MIFYKIFLPNICNCLSDAIRFYFCGLMHTINEFSYTIFFLIWEKVKKDWKINQLQRNSYWTYFCLLEITYIQKHFWLYVYLSQKINTFQLNKKPKNNISWSFQKELLVKLVWRHCEHMFSLTVDPSLSLNCLQDPGTSLEDNLLKNIIAVCLICWCVY